MHLPRALSALLILGLTSFATAQEGGLKLLEGNTGENPYAEPLVTDRPDFTEASSTVGHGVVQLETGYTYAYRDDEATGMILQGHSGPEALFRIGLSDPIELRIGWNYAWVDGDVGASRFSFNGSEDLYLGLKLALYDQENWFPEQAVIVQMTAPTGGADFTTDDTEFGVNYLYSWELPNTWSLAGSSGFDTDSDEFEDLVVWHQSVALGIPLSEQFGMYIEYFGLYEQGGSDDTHEHYIDGGFTWLYNYNIQYDIRAGKGLNDDSDDFFAGIGGSFRF